MSVNLIHKYKCICCDQSWSKKFNYERHMSTDKHSKMSKKSNEIEKKSEKIEKTLVSERIFLPNEENIIIEQKSPITKTVETRYCCDYCKFSTNNKKESEKHRKSKQHMKNENKEEDFLEITNEYICVKCDKCYKNYKTCWGHSKRCEGKMEEKENIVFTMVEDPVPPTPAISAETIKKDIMESIVEKFLDNNKHMMDNNKHMIEQIVSVVKTVIMETQQQQQVLLQPQNTITQNNILNNSNNTNNHCTINMFLNDKCKDALNITDWVDNMILDFDNLYYNAENGFQKGLSKMLIDNLKLYNTYQRPIHFTDIKRDVMYIKDDDAWTKHENTDKLIEVFEKGARQGIRCFAAWMEENAPAYHDLDSQLGQLYMKIHQTVIRGASIRDKAYPKIIREFAHAAQLRKEDQIAL
jgi:hypothetical protein